MLVTLSINTKGMADVVGCYNKTGRTHKVHTWNRPVYKKSNPTMYLQQETTGDWVITPDRGSKSSVRLRQANANYQPYPDNDYRAAWKTRN